MADAPQLIAWPAGTAPAAAPQATPVLAGHAVTVRRPLPGPGFAARSFAAVDDVSLALGAGEAVALVGESGSGKTTLALVLLRLLQTTAGRVFWDGVDVTRASKRTLRPLRQRFQMVFQDPLGSLDPRLSVRAALHEPLRAHGLAPRRELAQRSAQLLAEVGLEPHLAARYPHALSGGERQRVAVARALALAPAVLVADEPAAALDVSARAHLLQALDALRRNRQLALLYISHDLLTVRALADRVAVLLAGRLVEAGPADAVLASPVHPYTRALVAAVPVPDPALARPLAERGEPALSERAAAEGGRPAAADGCPYAPRCSWTRPDCLTARPPWREVTPQHGAACPGAA